MIRELSSSRVGVESKNDENEWIKKLWYNVTLHSYKNECIWAAPNVVDEARAYYTEEVSQIQKLSYIYT